MALVIVHPFFLSRGEKLTNIFSRDYSAGLRDVIAKHNRIAIYEPKETFGQMLEMFDHYKIPVSAHTPIYTLPNLHFPAGPLQYLVEYSWLKSLPLHESSDIRCAGFSVLIQEGSLELKACLGRTIERLRKRGAQCTLELEASNVSIKTKEGLPISNGERAKQIVLTQNAIRISQTYGLS